MLCRSCNPPDDRKRLFSGMKKSGIGSEGSEEALRFLTEPKNVCIAKQNAL